MEGAEMSAEWFAGRLKELREAAGLTQAQLAEKAGMNRFGVAQLEQGRHQPSWESVLALARALGVSCDAFAEEPKPTAPARRGRPRKTAEKETQTASTKAPAATVRPIGKPNRERKALAEA